MALRTPASALLVSSILCAGVAAAQDERDAQIDPFRPRGQPAAGRAANQRGLIASVEFVDSPITDVFKMISDATGWSIITSPGVSAEKGPTVNLFVKNIDPADLLEQVALSANLVTDQTGNVVHVMTFDEFARVRGVERRVIQLKHADAAAVASLLQPFIKTEQSKVLADTAGNKLVLLIPEPLVETLAQLVASLDVPFAKDEVRVVKLKHLEADRLAPALEEFLTGGGAGSDSRLFGGGVGNPGPAVPLAPAPANPPPAGAPAPPVVGPGVNAADAGRRAGEAWLVQFFVEPKLNLVVLRGLADDVEKTAKLIAELDVPSDIKVVAYPLRYTNAADAFDTLQQLVLSDLRGGGGGGGRSGGGGRGAFGVGGGLDAQPRLRVAASGQNNQIVAEGSPDDHARLAAIVEAIDRPLPAGSGSIRVYKLENATSTEVAEVLSSIVEDRERQAVRSREAANAGTGGPGGTGRLGARAGGTFGPRGRGGPYARPGGAGGAAGPAGASGAAGPGASAAVGDGDGGSMEGGEPGGSGDVVPPRITDAPEINAVVIRASAAEHEELESVIRDLDKPRDQVVLEVTLVTVRASDTFNLGIEVGAGGADLIGFSTFGVGAVDPATGRLSIANPPAPGLNFGVIDAGDFSLVLNTLKSVGDVRVSSAPKILVEDNSPAQIRQVSQEPYAVTSQGESSTITSFGDYVEAGTTLTVTPHISRDQWLRLEYAVNLSSFDQRNAQQLAANLPPPTRESESTGTVRIPSDSMVVLGGVVATRDEKTNDKVPFLGDIPILGLLFGQQFVGTSNETLFIFIRPTILRDPSFRDLRYISEDDVQAARLSMDEYPQNAFKSLAPRPGRLGQEGR